MRLAILTLGLGLGFVLSGCAQMPTHPATAPAQGVQTGAQQAIFPEYPGHLFFAATQVCNAPGQSIITSSPNEVRCESLPDPQSAAVIILQFNGTVESLPTFIISFSGRAVENGYLVTADNYIRVPQRSGPAQQVRFPDLVVNAEVAALLEAAGGRPL